MLQPWPGSIKQRRKQCGALLARGYSNWNNASVYADGYQREARGLFQSHTGAAVLCNGNVTDAERRWGENDILEPSEAVRVWWE